MNKKSFLKQLNKARKPITIDIEGQEFYIKDLTQTEAVALEIKMGESEQDYVLRMITSTFVNKDGSAVEGLDTLTFEELSDSLSIKQMAAIGEGITKGITGDIDYKDTAGNLNGPKGKS